MFSFLVRPVFAAAVALCLVGAMPASAEPLVSIEWLKQHRSDPSVVTLDVRSAIDGGGAEAYARAHIPGAIHSDYDKAGWRVTRNGVPFMLPTTGTERPGTTAGESAETTQVMPAADPATSDPTDAPDEEGRT